MKNRALKITLITVLSLIVLIILAVLTTVAVVTHGKDYVEFDADKLNNINNTLTVLDDSGNLINEPIYINQYKQVPLESLKSHTVDAFVFTEDKRFYTHKGLDYKRIGGAMLHNVTSLSFKEGASTISQQLIKNTHLDNSKTVQRKINEMMLAKQLEKHFSKSEILEMYLNTIYFGRNAYGIESAANVYFAKSAEELNIEESATLAGMIKAPNIYAPDKNETKCLNRRNTVLKLMADNGCITQSEYREASSSPVLCSSISDSPEKTYIYGVIDEACAKLNMSPLQLINSGLTIETYYSSVCQKAVTEAVKADDTRTAGGKKSDLCFIVCDTKSGVQAFYGRGTGDMLDKKRQIGSTAKPIAVYGPALNEKLITEASPILDEKTDFAGYSPGNYGDTYYGWTTVKDSLVKSLNVPAVRTLNSLGMPLAEKYLKNYGVQEKQNLSLALGNVNGGMNARQLVSAYACLSNGGRQNDAAFIKSIANKKGRLYLRRNAEKQIFDERTAYIITDMLCEVVNSGTAARIKKAGLAVAAKTGTVGGEKFNTDALVAGYAADCVFTVWLSGELSNSVTGGTSPCVAAERFLSKYYGKNKPKAFNRPEGVIELEVDKSELYDNQLVLLAGDIGESSRIKFLFDKTNCPKKYAEKKKVEFTLEARASNGAVEITLPLTDCSLKLYRSEGNGSYAEVSHDGRIYVDRDVQSKQTYTYFAEAYLNGKKVYTCPTVKINIPEYYNGGTKAPNNDKDKKIDEGNKFEGLLDFWYLGKRRG